MAQIIHRVEAHYEAREVPFGKTYEWHPAYVALECDCGEQLILYRYQRHNHLSSVLLEEHGGLPEEVQGNPHK